ncbi:uncharacterized protein LOC124931812 isoform X5 [Impatiens glandulifera]|nr:uncharacterized protein LOC124931812 isoform X5 [Impatiens glandulifera]
MEYSDWRDMVRVVKIRRIKSRLHQLGIEPGIWHRKRVPVTKHEWNVWKLFEVLESFQVDPRMGGGRSLEGHDMWVQKGYRKRVPATKHEWNVWKLLESLGEFSSRPESGRRNELGGT